MKNVGKEKRRIKTKRESECHGIISIIIMDNVLSINV